MNICSYMQPFGVTSRNVQGNSACLKGARVDDEEIQDRFAKTARCKRNCDIQKKEDILTRLNL